jgi:hypothetical protein
MGEGKLDMPYIHFREIWTPLRLLGTRVYVTDEGDWYIKVLNAKRKRIKRGKKRTSML